MFDIIEVGMINLTPTMKCNLKCKLCGVLVPHYEYCPQMSIEEFENMLDALFQIVDHVGKLQITGGEPFVYPHLAKCIELCFKYAEKFDCLWVFTNGTVPMKPQVTDIIKKYSDKILVHVSDYGIRREITEGLVKNLEFTGCQYRYLKYFGDQQYYDGWVDQGDFICHNRNEDELRAVFATCPHVCRGGSWYVRNGQMHWCGRSVRGVEVGKIPLVEDDYVDIFKGTREEKRKKFSEVMKRQYIEACNYCNGNYGTEEAEKRYPAGEQM